MPPSLVVLQLLSYVGLGIALAVIPLAATRARPAAWGAHALLTALCAISLIFVSGHWVFEEMVPWWRFGAFYAAQFVIPTAVAAWGAPVAVRRWPTRPWFVAGASVIGVFLVAIAVGTQLHLVPDLVNAVQ